MIYASIGPGKLRALRIETRDDERWPELLEQAYYAIAPKLIQERGPFLETLTLKGSNSKSPYLAHLVPLFDPSPFNSLTRLNFLVGEDSLPFSLSAFKHLTVLEIGCTLGSFPKTS